MNKLTYEHKLLNQAQKAELKDMIIAQKQIKDIGWGIQKKQIKQSIPRAATFRQPKLSPMRSQLSFSLKQSKSLIQLDKQQPLLKVTHHCDCAFVKPSLYTDQNIENLQIIRRLQIVDITK